MSVYIRKATLEDALRCAEIHSRSWDFAYSSCVPHEEIEKLTERSPMIWKRMLEKEPHNNYVVIEQDETVGILTFGKARDKDLPDTTGELVGLYLDPDFIGLGIGTKVMEFIKSDLKAAGFSTMVLWVLDQNYRAKAFYEKFGFKFDGTKKPSGLGERLEERYITEL